MRKVLTHTENSKKQSDNSKTTPKTLITQRLRTINWSDDSHQTDVVKPIYGTSTFQLNAKAVESKGHTYKDRGPTANQCEDAIK